MPVVHQYELLHTSVDLDLIHWKVKINCHRFGCPSGCQSQFVGECIDSWVINATIH